MALPGVFLIPLELSQRDRQGGAAQGALLSNRCPCVSGIRDVGRICRGN